MTIDPANLDGQSLVSRAKAILLAPRETWDEIAREPVEVDDLYMRYAAPLAVLSALCLTIGLVFFRWGAGGFYAQLNPVQALVSGVVQFAAQLASIYIMARVIDGFAPAFGVARDRTQAHKLAVYSSTAMLLSGVFSLHPWFGAFALLGLYSLVLLYLGLPRLTDVSAEKRLPYFGAIIGVTIVAVLALGLVLGAVRGAVVNMTGGIMAPIGQQRQTEPAQAELAVPGGSIDVRMLEKQAQRYGAARPAIDPARLEELLPQTLPSGFERAELSSSVVLGMAQAAAQYRNGDAHITVTLARIEGAESTAAIAQAANIQANRRDEDGFSRVQTINGRVYSEQVSVSQRSASYAIVGSGVLLAVEGASVTPDQVRAAAETIGIQRLEQQFGD